MNDPEQGLSALSIRRPLLAMVLNLLIVIAGLAAVFSLDIRELPNMDRPTVMVRASYPGASPETVDAEVTAVLEDAIARVPGVRSIDAASEETSARLRISFSIDTDMDNAATDVREAVSQIERDLPPRLDSLTITKSDANAEPVIQIAVVPDSFDHMALSDRVENDIVPMFYTLPDVASVELFGVRSRQMRVALDPLQLSRYKLSVRDVVNALQQASFDIPVGSYVSRDQELLVRAVAPAITATQIEMIQVTESVRIGDVAQAYFAPAKPANFVRLNGEPAIGLGILRQANSNTVDISSNVRDLVSRLNDRYSDLTITITSDQSVFIDSAITEVLQTLALTIGTVMLSILVFFGRFRATVIPSLAIPAALIGSLAGFWLFGFSINLITLLALVLATGLTVDDAIVVLENCQRHQGQGADRRNAARWGARQVFFAVISTTLVLIAVFVPISFLPSTTGRLFREFGLVLAVAVIISSFVALTLVPAIAARINLAPAGSPGGLKMPLTALLQFLGQHLKDSYVWCVERAIAHSIPVIAICAIFLAIVIYALPGLNSELVPDEDRGTFQVMASGPDGVGIEYMQAQADKVEQILLDPAHSDTVQSVYTIVGQWDPNRVFANVMLHPWRARSQSQDDILQGVRGALREIPGLRTNAFGRSSLETDWDSRSGLNLSLTGPTYEKIHTAAMDLAVAMEEGPFADVEISYNPTQPQIALQVDRESAARLDVPLEEVADTLAVLVGGEELVNLNVNDQTVPIILSAPTGLIHDPADLQGLYVTANNGALVPVSSLTQVSQMGIAAELERAGQRRAIGIEADIGNLPVSQAIEQFRAIADQVLPSDIDVVLEGEAQNFAETSRDLTLTYIFAGVIILLVLIAQFESLRSPLVVILTVPFGLAAVLAAMIINGVVLNIYSQIGLVLLIGLTTKNAILLVEFADQKIRDGEELVSAILSASQTRLRPICMTLISTMLGSVPLILSTGAGAEARAAIGWTIFAGLGLSSFFTLFLTPVLYRLIARGPAREIKPEFEHTS